MKLEKRQPRFSKDRYDFSAKMKGYTLPQRSHEKLPHNEKPQHGVPQEMPPRD